MGGKFNMDERREQRTLYIVWYEDRNDQCRRRYQTFCYPQRLVFEHLGSRWIGGRDGDVEPLQLPERVRQLQFLRRDGDVWFCLGLLGNFVRDSHHDFRGIPHGPEDIYRR